MKTMVVSGKVCLCIFAAKDIAPNTEPRYDYGLKDLPWRVKSGMTIIPMIVHSGCSSVTTYLTHAGIPLTFNLVLESRKRLA